ncbi:MAG: hypothetical protein ACP5JB_07630 [candidate division WOR-3 bacterium]
MTPILLLILGIIIRNDAGLSGYYSSLRYPVADTVTRDTTLPNTELRSYWSINLDAKQPGYQIQTDNNLQLSTASLTDYLNFACTVPLNQVLNFATGVDGEVCYYHHYLPLLADTTLRNSYLNAKLSAGLQYRLNDRLTISARDNLEHQHYLPVDSFYYNYYLNRAKLGFDAQLSELSTLTLECGLNRLWTRTQPGQNYTESSLYLNWNVYPGTDWNLQFDNSLTRRSYPEKTRSYLELNPALVISRNFGSALELSLNASPRMNLFDETTTVYQNQITSQLGMECQLQPSNGLTLRAGPQTELLRSLDRISSQDYHEISLSLAIELVRSARFWITAENRYGIRRYLLNDSALQSDYRFNEFNLYSTWKITNLPPGELSLELMLNIAPEWHSEAIDNLAALTSSLQLRYRW